MATADHVRTAHPVPTAHIIVTEFMDAQALDTLRAGFDVHYDPDLHSQGPALMQAVVGARAIIVRNQTKVTAALLDAAPNLKAVGRLGVGLDNIDVPACEARGVAVYPATGANVVSVAEYVIAAALIGLRGAYGSSAQVVNGEWPRTALVGRELSGSLLGIVGFGAIGRAVADRAVAMGCCVQAFDPALAADDAAWARHRASRCETLDALLANSKVVTLHVPLVHATRHLIDAAAIARMPDDAWLINTARGGVVDETALGLALKAGQLGGAVLDVFEHEPLGAGSGLEDVPNLIATPHIAGLTDESQVRVGTVVANAIERHLNT